MKVKTLKLNTISSEENKELLINNSLQNDLKFLKRSKRDIEDEIEDKVEELNKRLSSDTPLDASVISVLYGGIKDLKAKLELYNEFEKEFYTEKLD